MDSGRRSTRLGLPEILRIGQKSVRAWSDDFAPSMGAAISYYTVFSIAPLLLIVIAVAGTIFDRSAAQDQILLQIRGLLGTSGATAVESLLGPVTNPARGTLAAFIGVVTLLLGATSVFAELQSALDRIWKVPPEKRASGVWGLLRARLLSFGMILGVGFLLAVSVVVECRFERSRLLVGAGFQGMGNHFASDQCRREFRRRHPSVCDDLQAASPSANRLA